jgi:hypothetical protein
MADKPRYVIAQVCSDPMCSEPLHEICEGPEPDAWNKVVESVHTGPDYDIARAAIEAVDSVE